MEQEQKRLIPIYEKWAEGMIQKYQRKGQFSNRKFKGVTEAIKDFKTSSGFILDAGSGTGSYTNWLVKHTHCQVVALDISLRLLQSIQKEALLGDNQRRPYLVRASLEALPFKNKSFDRILCTQVVEHLLNDKIGCKQLYSVLKERGVMILTTDNAENHVTKIFEFPVSSLKRFFNLQSEPLFLHRDYYNEELQILLQNAGFSITKAWTFRFSIPSPISRIVLFQLVLDMVERAVIKLPVLRRWGDIIVVKCHRSEL